jgi:hypothetical protein
LVFRLAVGGLFCELIRFEPTEETATPAVFYYHKERRMITSPAQEANRNARNVLIAAHVETGDDPRTYTEIAESLGLIATEENLQLTLPEEQTTL